MVGIIIRTVLVSCFTTAMVKVDLKQLLQQIIGVKRIFPLKEVHLWGCNSPQVCYRYYVMMG